MFRLVNGMEMPVFKLGMLGGHPPLVHGTGPGLWPYGKGKFMDWIRPIADRNGRKADFEPYMAPTTIPDQGRA